MSAVAGLGLMKIVQCDVAGRQLPAQTTGAESDRVRRDDGNEKQTKPSIKGQTACRRVPYRSP